MGKDYPDWGTYTGEFKAGAVRDLAELAVRLGAPTSLSGSGQWMFCEDFRLGLGRWTISASGGGIVPYLSAGHWLYGGFSAVLQCGTGMGGQSGFNKILAAYPDTPLGLQVGFSFTNPEVWLVLWSYQVRNSVRSDYVFRINPFAKLVQVQNDAATFETLLSDVNLSIGADKFHVMKFTWTAAGPDYGFMQLDNNMVSNMPVKPYSYNTTDVWEVAIGVYAESYGYPDTEIYIDHVIPSYNEAL